MADPDPNPSETTRGTAPPTPPGSHHRLGEQPGDWIGPYKLLQVIGEGGFGIVWLAERREPMVQRVALKIIKPGMDSRSVIARFEQERQALAVMDHPNIAKVFDGGVTPSGRPYFVMEHVKGEPITGFCDRNRLTIKRRLELFQAVCDAVQHAHMRGVFHRDLKPGNILVVPGESEGSNSDAYVKVIDFGVAKAVHHTMTEKTIFTEHGQIIGTPEYMSPEQAEMGAVEIDGRTDVYSLGVLLYELLTGSLPIDRNFLLSKGYAQIQNLIREADPPTPSKRLTTLGDAVVEIARKRHTERQDLLRQLRGELEWITLKALQKTRADRYESPASFAADITRFLSGSPVLAGRHRRTYAIVKWLGRHRRLGAVALIVLVAIGAGYLVARRPAAPSGAEGSESNSGVVELNVTSSLRAEVDERDLISEIEAILYESQPKAIVVVDYSWTEDPPNASTSEVARVLRSLVSNAKGVDAPLSNGGAPHERTWDEAVDLMQRVVDHPGRLAIGVSAWSKGRDNPEESAFYRLVATGAGGRGTPVEPVVRILPISSISKANPLKKWCAVVMNDFLRELNEKLRPQSVTPPAALQFVPMGPVTRITVHHSGNAFQDRARSASEIMIEQIRKAHMAQGYLDIGYHWIIDPAGRLWRGRSQEMQGAHVSNGNEGNVGIVVLGNFDADQPTPESLLTLEALLRDLEQRHRLGADRVLTHQELRPSACPGRHLQSALAQMRSRNFSNPQAILPQAEAIPLSDAQKQGPTAPP